MSKNLRECLKHLELVAQIKNAKTRASVLKDISVKDCYYDAIHEITINALKGNIPLSTYQKSGLGRNKRKIKALLCAKKRPKKFRTKAVVQSGGWIQYLIPAVGALLGNLIRN
jgi:hypothetical protein